MARILFLLLLLSSPLAAQTSAGNQQADELQLSHVHVDWPAPETLLRDLRSTDDQTRFKALTLLGVKHPGFPVDADPKTGSPAKTIVRDADESELRYGSLGASNDQEAIIGVDIGPDLYGAVAIQTLKGWQRIANFYCWCRYENGDLLAGFIHVEYADEGNELVVHASGGGTGLYVQDEYRFRVHEGELKTVLSFTSRFRECPWSPSGNGVCDGEQRQFDSQESGRVAGGVLVEAKFRFQADDIPKAEYSMRELELLHGKSPTCTKYVWDEIAFRYIESSEAHACREAKVEK
ncbi:MAG TPA: hypothetical protein VMB02_07225 [Candidatus Aquilonibacter sp.]|jgi:hypothetical protein|nr:hypothetical protein [Candidatus Aquilonibacter sp.]